jgi:butyryl-CoA dehydrogenase
MNFKLDENQQLLQNEAQKLAREVFKDRAVRWDQNAEVPWDNIRLLAEQGYLGLLIPEQYGGSGGSIMDLVLVLEQFGWACVSTTMYAFSSNVHANRIDQLGADEHRAKYLPGIATGDLLPCHAMSEPQAGSDANRMHTSAAREGDHYVINGNKCWISRGAVAHLYLVDVVFKDSEKEEKGLLLVERGTPGLEIGKVEPMMGHRGSPSTELIFNDCRVPVGNRMAHGDFNASLMSMSLSRCCNAAIALGAAQRAYDECVEYVQQREAFGKRLSDFQGLRWTVADMAVEARCGETADLPRGSECDRRLSVGDRSRHREDFRERDRALGGIGRNAALRRERLLERVSARAHLPRCARLLDRRRHDAYPAEPHSPRRIGAAQILALKE